MREGVIVSDDAGQFKVGPGMACVGVHAERLVHKLDTFTESKTAPPSPPFRATIWQLYKRSQGLPLARPRRSARPIWKPEFESRPSPGKTGFITLDPPARTASCPTRPELLKVLDRPEISAAYQQLLRTTSVVTSQKAQTLRRNPQRSRSRRTRHLPRASPSTCTKLGISFSGITLGARLNLPRRPPSPPLANLIPRQDRNRPGPATTFAPVTFKPLHVGKMRGHTPVTPGTVGSPISYRYNPAVVAAEMGQVRTHVRWRTSFPMTHCTTDQGCLSEASLMATMSQNLWSEPNSPAPAAGL